MTAQPAGATPLAVVIVDDSAVQRRFLRALIDADPRLTVVGEARNGRDAVALVERLRPGAVLMDLHLPGMNGIEAIESIMARHPTPILVHSAFVDGDDRDNAAAALAAGAVDVMAKPGARAGAEMDEYGDSLRRRLWVAGRVRVITHPRGRLGHATSAAVTTRRLSPSVPRPRSADGSSAAGSDAPSSSARRAAAGARPARLVAIGASTGGPQALARLFAQLPSETDAAVVVVQHMADGFIEGLAAWLDSLCPLPVGVGASGRRLQPGTVTVAPSGINLIVHDHFRVTTEQPPPSQFHVPGIDATFSSVADAFGADAAGVLLTGMGRDGAVGLRRMRDAGAFTVAQDEATSAVYGMPAAAVALDGVDAQLALPDIAPVLRRMLGAEADEGSVP